MNGVVTGVKLDNARNNYEHGVFSDDCAQEADDEIANRKRDAKLLSHPGAGTRGYSEQQRAQDDVGQIMGERMVMFLVSARNIEKSQNAKYHVQNTCNN